MAGSAVWGQWIYGPWHRVVADEDGKVWRAICGIEAGPFPNRVIDQPNDQHLPPSQRTRCNYCESVVDDLRKLDRARRWFDGR